MKKLVLALVALTATTLGACGSDDAGAADPTADSPVAITVANLAVANSAGLVLGVEKGFFTDEGLDVTLKDTPAASTVPAVVSGEAQFAFTGIPPLINARANKLPVQAVAPAAGYPDDLSQSQIQLVAPAGSPLTGVADLAGKTIAVDTLYQLPHLSLIEALQSAGVDTSSVTFTEIPYPSMLDAMASGKVDAADLADPFLGQSLAAGGVPLISNGEGFDPGATQVIWVASEQYIAKNPKVVAAFSRAVEKSNAYAQEHPDELRQVVPSYMPIDAQQAARLLLPKYTTSIDDGVFDVYVDLLLEQKVIDDKIDVGDAVHDS